MEEEESTFGISNSGLPRLAIRRAGFRRRVKGTQTLGHSLLLPPRAADGGRTAR